MKISRDNKQFYTAILTELSKAFDSMRHDDLLIAQLQNALKIIYNYLCGRSQKVKVGSSSSSNLDISSKIFDTFY